MVIGIRQNAPIRQLLFDVFMRTSDTVARWPIPWAFYGNFKLLKISNSEVFTVTFCRYNFFHTVTEGNVCSLHIRLWLGRVSVAHVHPTATESELRLMKVASRWSALVLLSSYCYSQLQIVFHLGPCIWYLTGRPNLRRYERHPGRWFHRRVKLLTVGYTACSVNGAFIKPFCNRYAT